MRNKVTWMIVILTLIGILTRFTFVTSVPGNLQSDTVDTIRSFLEHAHRQEYDLFSTNWNGSHIVNQWMVAVPWYTLGRPYWAVSITASVLSIICSLAFFGLVLGATKRPGIAFITSLWLMVDPWFLNFSRAGWENIANCLMVIGLLYALVLPAKKLSIRLSLLLLVATVSPYLYHPGKIVAVIAVGALVVILVRAQKILWKQKLGILAVCMVTIGLSIMPLLMTPSVNQLGRIATVSVFSYEDPLASFVESLERNLLGFTTFQSEQWHVGLNSRYLPLAGWILPPLIVGLYWLGTLFALRKRWWVILVGFLLIYPVNLLSMHTPDAARTVHALPYIYLMVAFGLLGLLKFAHFISNRYHLSTLRGYELGTLVAKGALAIVVISLAVQQFLTYWIWITNPTTLRGREPAIYHYEYQQWLRDIDSQLDEMGRTLSIYEWKDET